MSSRLRSLALLCVAACAETQPVQRPPQPASRALGDTALLSLPPTEQYRLAWRWPETRAPEQALIGGLRVSQKPEPSIAQTAAVPALDDGRPVPAAWGGGYVFWSHRGLYRSADFTGRLQPFAPTPFVVSDVSFGPGFWLARAADGERLALDPKTGAARAVSPLGLIDIGAEPDGRVVATAELGRALVSVDSGASYRDVAAELGRGPWQISREPLGFTTERDSVWTLSKDGKLTQSPLQSPPPPERVNLGKASIGRVRRWPNRHTEPRPWVPLNEAVSRGIVQTPGSALVALSASLAEVDLGSGELKQQGPQLLPGSPDCELLRQGSELLMACLPQSALVILSIAAHKPSSIERRFNGHPALRVSAGQLLVEASCDGDPTPGSVCVRAAGGDWKQLSLHTEAPTLAGSAGAGGGPAASATKPARPFAYVPRAEGGAVALVREPVHGYVDLASGRAVALSGDFEDVARSPEHCLLDTGGSLRCLTVNGPVAFDRDGKQEPRVFRFNWSTASGLRGLGRDSDGRLFQTEDLGRTWVEVAAPPAWGDPGGNQDRCSEAGCRLWGWLRTGWERTSPRATEPPEVIAIGEAPTPPRPLLACRALQIPALTRNTPLATPDAPAVGDEASPFVFGFGSERLSSQKFQLPIEAPTPSQAPGGAGDVATRGMLSSHTTQHADPKHPEVVITDFEPFRLRYVQHFEPTARPQLASVTFAELLRAARRLAAPEPSAALEGTGSLLTTPVLGREPGKSAGFLTLLDSARIWVSGSQVVALTPTPGTWIASGAAVDRDGSLLVLFVADDLATRLWRFRQGAGVELFAVPAPSARTSYATSDALGVSARGELAVLRFPSGEQPPSEADPALAYVPGKPLEQLAPWSQLRSMGDPACADKSGYRAIVAAPQGWLSLRRGDDDVTDGWGTIAAVRWSHERVCLEALETADSDYEHGDENTETRVILSEVPKPAAARVGFGPGFELREPLSCELSR